MGIGLLAQESNPSQLVRLCGAHPDAVGAIHPIGHPTAPGGADGRSEARSETRLLRYLLNGLELVELMAGCASGTHGKDMDSSGMLISALRHGFTCDAFTAKWMSRFFWFYVRVLGLR